MNWLVIHANIERDSSYFSISVITVFLNAIHEMYRELQKSAPEICKIILISKSYVPKIIAITTRS